jgi:hypothetical protein
VAPQSIDPCIRSEVRQAQKDGAHHAYHKARPKDETWKTATDKDRDWLEAYVYRAEIPFIVRADKKKIPPHKYTCTKAKGGLTVQDLKTVVQDHIESHPSNTTLVKEIMQVKKHELLYTVPYESWMQPIEVVWAQVKHQVARQARRRRKWQETQRQLERHCRRWMHLPAQTSSTAHTSS